MSEYMVGVRYSYKDARVGAGMTVVIENQGEAWRKRLPKELVELAKPVAGPIRREMSCYVGTSQTIFFAVCENCNQESKVYKTPNNSGIWGWARSHRCKVDE